MAGTEAPPRLPISIRDLAARLGVSADTGSASVILTQSGRMRDPPVRRWMSFNARQNIAIDRLGFSWKARTGPLGCITVVDALADGKGDLSVKLLGLLPVAHVWDNDEVTRGELLRYLAELPWAPDAILRNRELSWSFESDRKLTLTASGVVIDIELDPEGRVGSVRADRPRKEGTAFVTRPWRGRFFDYRQVHGRCIPHAAEVGWVLDGALQLAWRGTLTSWTVT